MHLLNLPDKLPILDYVKVELIEVSQRRKSRSREFGERMKVNSVDHERDNVKDGCADASLANSCQVQQCHFVMGLWAEDEERIFGTVSSAFYTPYILAAGEKARCGRTPFTAGTESRVHRANRNMLR